MTEVRVSQSEKVSEQEDIGRELYVVLENEVPVRDRTFP